VLESNFWRGGVGEPGPWEREFEERFSRKYGCAYSSLVSNGIFALYAALVSLGIGVQVSLGLILLIKPFSSASPPSGSHFIGIHIAGLHPPWATPTHSSTFIASSGSLLWGNPYILGST
jgi:hypothetical protein